MNLDVVQADYLGWSDSVSANTLTIFWSFVKKMIFYVCVSALTLLEITFYITCSDIFTRISFG